MYEEDDEIAQTADMHQHQIVASNIPITQESKRGEPISTTTRQTDKRTSKARALDVIQRRDRYNADQVEETYNSQSRGTKDDNLLLSFRS